MFAIEDALADVVARSTQPALGAIKLAWWRERLEELDQGEIPNEPRLQAAADELLPRGVSGADLARLEEGWAGLLSDPIELSLLEEHGAKLFLVGARLLGVDFDDSTIGTAGRLFARVDASASNTRRVNPSIHCLYQHRACRFGHFIGRCARGL